MKFDWKNYYKKDKKIKYIFDELPFFWFFQFTLSALIKRVLELGEVYDKQKEKQRKGGTH